MEFGVNIGRALSDLPAGILIPINVLTAGALCKGRRKELIKRAKELSEYITQRVKSPEHFPSTA